MSKRTTIKDVAKVAGVSTATVSLALNGNPAVNKDTRRRILETAERLRYVPNEIARRFQSQCSNTIAVIIPHNAAHVFSHPYFMGIFQGITEVLEQHDMTMTISTSPSEMEEERAYLKILQSGQADAAIVASAAETDRNSLRIAYSGYPVVFIGTFNDPAVISVGVDDENGAFMGAEHMIVEHGFERIAYLSGPLGHLPARNRLEGFRKALSKHGLPLWEKDLFEGDFSEESGYIGMQKVLAQSNIPPAVFAGNDLMAIGAIQAANEKGLSVPEDMAIIGFDDIKMSTVVTPALTTIHQPIVELGHQAAEMLLSRLSISKSEEETSTESLPMTTVLPTSLVVRRSCGCKGGDQEEHIE